MNSEKVYRQQCKLMPKLYQKTREYIIGKRNRSFSIISQSQKQCVSRQFNIFGNTYMNNTRTFITFTTR